MRFETDKDRKEQYAVGEFLGEKWGCEMFETSREDALPYDFTALRGNLMVSLVEVKCRNVDSKFIEEHGALMEHERLNRLYKEGKKERVGAIVVWKTSDGCVYYCSAADMAAAIELKAKEMTKAPPEFMKDNHGKELADKRGWIVKRPLLKRAGKMS